MRRRQANPFKLMQQSYIIVLPAFAGKTDRWKISIKNIIAIIFIATLTSCGFHLRSEATLSKSIHKIYLQNSGTSDYFNNVLIKNLQLAGVQLTASPDTANKSVVILQQSFSQIRQPLGIGQQLNKIDLTYQVTLVERTPQGKDLNFPVTLTTSTIYLQNANQVLSDLTALPRLKNNLSEAMAQKIVTYLSHEN